MNKWLKIILIILCFALISISIYAVLKICNLADIEKIKTLIKSSSKYGVAVYLIITTLCLIFLCFVPILNSALVVLGIILLGTNLTFIVCLIANFLSASALFFIGDKFGEKLVSKFIGKDELIKTQNLIDRKSKFMLPILFIIPAIPDEALCLVAGMTKMKYWYLITVDIIYHAVEIGLFCFLGSEIIDWSNLSILDWIILCNVLIIDVYFLFKIEKIIENKSKK